MVVERAGVDDRRAPPEAVVVRACSTPASRPPAAGLFGAPGAGTCRRGPSTTVCALGPPARCRRRPLGARLGLASLVVGCGARWSSRGPASLDLRLGAARRRAASSLASPRRERLAAPNRPRPRRARPRQRQHGAGPASGAARPVERDAPAAVQADQLPALDAGAAGGAVPASLVRALSRSLGGLAALEPTASGATSARPSSGCRRSASARVGAGPPRARRPGAARPASRPPRRAPGVSPGSSSSSAAAASARSSSAPSRRPSPPRRRLAARRSRAHGMIAAHACNCRRCRPAPAGGRCRRCRGPRRARTSSSTASSSAALAWSSSGSRRPWRWSSKTSAPSSSRSASRTGSGGASGAACDRAQVPLARVGRLCGPPAHDGATIAPPSETFRRVRRPRRPPAGALLPACAAGMR